MTKYLIAIAIIFPSITITYNTMKLVNVDTKMDTLISSHEDVSNEFFERAEQLEKRIAANTVAINDINASLTKMFPED